MLNPIPRERRNMVRWLVIYSVIALVAAYAIVFGMQRPHTLTAEERRVLTAYEPVRAALASDDLRAAKETAAKMAKEFADRPPPPIQRARSEILQHCKRRARRSKI